MLGAGGCGVYVLGVLRFTGSFSAGGMCGGYRYFVGVCGGVRGVCLRTPTLHGVVGGLHSCLSLLVDFP